MEKINLCIIGCGSIAKMHSRIARTLKSQVNLLYASRSLEKAQQYNAKFKGIGAFGSYEEAFASPDVHAVFICTPHAYHLEHGKLAAKYGKPALIEKPVTRSLQELDELQETVRQAGTVCMVAENFRFKPLVKVLRQHIDNGDIGDPLIIELNRINRGKIKGWRADAEMMGGGGLLEGGVHWVDLMVSIGGEVNQVLAIRPTKPYKMIAPFEDNIEVFFKYADGTVGKLLHAWNLQNKIGGSSVSKIFGTEGNIHFESNGLFALVLGQKSHFRFPGFFDLLGFRGMLKHFLECVRENKTPVMSLDVARREMQIVKAAYHSLESGRFEDVATATD